MFSESNPIVIRTEVIHQHLVLLRYKPLPLLYNFLRAEGCLQVSGKQFFLDSVIRA